MDLNNVKILLEINDSSQDSILTVLLTHSIQLINLYLNTTEIPRELEFIAEQITIKKYNRLGSEGVITEKLDVISNTYSLDDLAEYKGVLDMYKSTHLPPSHTTGRLRIL